MQNAKNAMQCKKLSYILYLCIFAKVLLRKTFTKQAESGFICMDIKVVKKIVEG